MRTDEPEMQTDAPEMQTDAPEMRTDKPGMQTDEPGMPTDEPGMQTDEPGMRTDALGMRIDTPIQTTVKTAGKTNFELMNSTKPFLLNFAKLPKTYAALCRLHLPRTLHDEVELEAVTEIIDLMAGHSLTADQADYLETLAELSAAYESARCDASPSQPPHEFLAAHLENTVLG